MIRKAATGPRTIGAYEVIERIATGGMSAVFKGRDPATGDLVAIKVLLQTFAGNPVVRKRFEQEYRITKKLHHPHLVRAIDFGEVEGLPYMVMEFVDGPSLGTVIEQRKRLPEEEAVRIITQIGQALEKAHERGIIHRDVKPDNILLAPGQQAKLTDLGLVKDTSQDLELTRTGGGLGTLNFMAPEQFDDAKNVGPRSDVYSLAATLYFAVTGDLPFKGRGMLNMLKKKMTRDIPPPRHVVRQLSVRVDEAILRALHPRPDQRPANCTEFLSELTRPIEKVEGLDGVKNQPTKSGKERRAAVRHASQLNSYCRAIGDSEYSWFAKVRDVSSGGIQLVMDRRFEPGTVLAAELQDRVGQPQRTALVRVVRVQSLPNRKWSMGCIFDYKLSEEDVLTLR